MATSEIDIVNLALVAGLGLARIESLDEDSKLAKAAKLLYPQVRDSLLEETHWTFARSEIALTSITNQWQSWTYAYSYPVDCLRIQYLIPGGLIADTTYWGEISPNQNEKQFPREVTVALNSDNTETGQKVILCNFAQAYLVYTKAITNTALFPNAFIDALWGDLAIALWPYAQTNPQILQRLQGMTAMAKATAKRTSSNESVEPHDTISDFQAYRN